MELAPGDLFHTLTYTSNYHPTRSWYVGHTWSLSVEEQFYLLWPALLVVLGGRRAFWAAALFVLAAPLIRLGRWQLTVSARDGVGDRFETVADAITVGCLLAGARAWLHRQPVYRRVLVSRWLLLAPLVLMVSLSYRPRIDFLVGFTLKNVLIALCIDRWVTDPTDRAGRILNSRPLVFVGLISYSIYLWQQLFLNRSVVSLPTSFPLNVALALLAALASYIWSSVLRCACASASSARSFPGAPRGPSRPTRQPSGGGVLEAAGQDGAADRAAEVADAHAENQRRARGLGALVEHRTVLGIAHDACLHADAEDVARRKHDVRAIDAALADLGDVALQADPERDRAGVRDAEALRETGQAQRPGGAGGELDVAVRAADLLHGGGAGVEASVAARGLGERAAGSGDVDRITPRDADGGRAGARPGAGRTRAGARRR